eukprot:1745135-Alexandrium_andersonii.AAC.1
MGGGSAKKWGRLASCSHNSTTLIGAQLLADNSPTRVCHHQCCRTCMHIVAQARTGRVGTTRLSCQIDFDQSAQMARTGLM